MLSIHSKASRIGRELASNAWYSISKKFEHVQSRIYDHRFFPARGRRLLRHASRKARFKRDRDPPVYTCVKFPITPAVYQFNSMLHSKRARRLTCP